MFSGFKAIVGNKINKTTWAFDLINAVVLDFYLPFFKYIWTSIQMIYLCV